MSYSSTLSRTSPFAMLTRSVDALGAAQWDQQSQSWVSASNTWSGDGLMWGAPTCTIASGGVICSVRFTAYASTDRFSFGSQWGSTGEARACSDDLMISYGSSAAWTVNNTIGTMTVDASRARCTIIRTSLS